MTRTLAGAYGVDHHEGVGHEQCYGPADIASGSNVRRRVTRPASLCRLHHPSNRLLVSVFLPLIASRVRSLLWPRISPSTSRVCSGLAVTGLWLPALVFLLSSSRVGSGATIWLIIPLCTPSGSARWVPALLAISAYVAGLAVSTVARNPWPWV
jgi:hypothetical protein